MYLFRLRSGKTFAMLYIQDTVLSCTSQSYDITLYIKRLNSTVTCNGLTNVSKLSFSYAVEFETYK